VCTIIRLGIGFDEDPERGALLGAQHKMARAMRCLLLIALVASATLAGRTMCSLHAYRYLVFRLDVQHVCML